jgi:predicted GNAT family N-acyltransferase
MKTKTAPIILSNVMISEMNKTLTFREITEPDELEKAFRFRYEEYSKSRLCPYLKKNEEKIDIDIFDLHSRHFGLFTNINQLIGCFRVVLCRNEFYNPVVLAIGLKHHFFNNFSHSKANFTKMTAPDFPFLSYQNLPDSIREHYHILKSNNENIAECSRLIIREDFRGIKTSLFLIECALMQFMIICSGKRHAVLDCCKDHQAFYTRLGFIPFDDGGGYEMFGHMIDVMFLPLDLSTMPCHFRNKFEQMANEFSQTNKISRSI